MIYILLLYALFATTFPLCKIAITSYIQPIFFTGICLLLAGIILIGYRFLTNKRALHVSKEQAWPLITLMLCNIYLTNVLERWGLQYLSSVKTSFIYNLSPLFAAFFSYVLLSEPMTMRKWLGFALGFLGFFPFFLTQSGSESCSGTCLCISWAELALVLASMTSVIGWISMRKLVHVGGCSVAANGISMFAGGLLMLVTSGLVESNCPWTVSISGMAPLYIAAVTLISYVLAYNIYGFLVERYTATFLTMAGLSSPVFTALFGWLLLKEKIGWTFALSTVMVSFGIYIFYQEELRAQKGPL